MKTPENASTELKTFLEDARRVANESGVLLPEPPYRFGLDHCWSCHREFLVFAWPSNGPWSTAEPPAEGRPATIAEVFGETVGYSYWSNTCPFCGERTGDYFLYFKPTGPFFSIEGDFREDTEESYTADMEAIAAWHRNPSRAEG